MRERPSIERSIAVAIARGDKKLALALIELREQSVAAQQAALRGEASLSSQERDRSAT